MPPEVAFADLQFIIEFVYRGEIDVSEAELQVSKQFFSYLFISRMYAQKNLNNNNNLYPCVQTLKINKIWSKNHMRRKRNAWMKWKRVYRENIKKENVKKI